ncbi:MarR family winged helix-turn-helix transcriptional regulator [Sneathiella glossodoripedis]|uniref:MarR family winged helix-turn-helix transcriptional regulator n=1 Tax=Sneathiella glossodoripedis TaxID=418853 RepID=UPI0004702D6B|nr:MarR family winged helix-turn-helix transcriptional regulator [Sneathiella glossodoripedis]
MSKAKPPRIFHQLQKAHTALFRAADARTKAELGLSTTQQAVLFVLSQKDGQAISAVAKTLSMGKSSLTGLVDRMCDQGLVRRSMSSPDGRVINIFIEDKGREIVNRSLPYVKHFNEHLLAPFSEAEQRTIHRFLEHVAQNADAIVALDPKNK